MSVLPPARPPTPSSLTASFPQPPSFSSFPSKNRRPPPAFPPPHTVQQPFASTSAFWFKQPHPSSLLSPTTPAGIRVSPSTTCRRARSADRGTNSPEESSMRTAGPRQVYSGSMPSSRGRSTTTTEGGIPPAYMVSRMRELAPMFWKNVAKSDCTILVQLSSSSVGPSPGSEGHYGSIFPSRSDAGTPPRGPSTPPLADGFSTGERRGPAPEMSGEVSVLAYHLHRDYLITQSLLFRKLLTPASAQTPSTLLPSTPNTSRTNNPSLQARLVRPLAPSKNPAILLPLPDPQSFGLITHFLYWGNASVVEKALFEGKVSFEGLVKNIEFLGLDNAFKIVCSHFWRKWIRPSTSFRVSQQLPASAPPSQTHFILTTPSSAGSSSQADSTHEQITPMSSTFNLHPHHPKGGGGLMLRGGESDDEEEYGRMGGFEDAELERRMRELGTEWSN